MLIFFPLSHFVMVTASESQLCAAVCGVLICSFVFFLLTIALPLVSLPCRRSTRTLSPWPPHGPSPPSTPSATACTPTERPPSSLPPCLAPSSPCPGSSAHSTINETHYDPWNCVHLSTPTPPLLLLHPSSHENGHKWPLRCASPLLWKRVWDRGRALLRTRLITE